MRAAAPACSLARVLRALAGDLSWERLGRDALLENASEILPKSLLEASRDLPELTSALLRLILTLLGVIWGLLGLILGLLGRSWAFLGRSWEPLGSLWDPPRPSKIAPGGSPGGPPHRSLILAPFRGSFWLHFGTDPPDLKKHGFRVESVAFFEKSRGSEKHPKNGNLAIMEREAR